MEQSSIATLPEAVCLLIEQFVQRQQFAFEVIREFRPHLIDLTKRRPSKAYASATGLGYWGHNKEWKYSLHGGGCRLTHTITGEPIDWDAPDLYRFDPYWFVYWLIWYLKQNVFFREPVEHEAVSIIVSMVAEKNNDAFRKRIFDVLEQLHQEGKLLRFPDRTSEYELVV